MARKMLINAVHPEEARVAIVEEGRLVELDIEIAGSEQTRGNVYKGVVVRVEPGLQAAFVDIGLKKLGFLQLGELHPDAWQWRDDIPEEQRKRRPRIQEVLRRGQELVVQVEKGERDMKGAALTTYLSFPGRYMVVMPGSDSAGVSRKVENEGDRKKLKEMAAELDIPEGIGYIIRTEALGKTKTELKKDLQSLIKLHKDILTRAKKIKAPAVVHQELDLVIRTIRDYFTAEIDEVLVDSPQVFEQAKAFFKSTMPKFEQIVKLHQEKRPIFSKYQLEEQIDQIYEKKVPLKSGGSLVIEPTEALVSIDVNSGKSTGERGVEDTAFKTNMEAAEEAARQLRLRDLGGLIVLDFIDMRDKKHIIEVEKTLKSALKADKARVTVGRISQFGMLEMSRQRIKQTLDQASVLECPHCEGRGKVKSVENMAISFLRKVHAAAAKGTVSEVRGGLPLEVAYYLLNRKKRELAQIENDYDIDVTIKGKPSFLMNQLELELAKREKPAHTEAVSDEEGAAATVVSEKPRKRGKGRAPVEAQVPETVPVAEVEEDIPVPAGEEVKGKKKRRRKKKGKGEAEGEAQLLPETVVEQEPGEESAALPESESTAEPVEGAPSSELAEGAKKKRRRRRRRGKGGTGEAGTAEAALVEAVGEEEEGDEEEASADTTADTAEQPEAGKKKRRRRRKKKGKGEASPEMAPVAPGETGVVEPAPAPEEASGVTAVSGAGTAEPVAAVKVKRQRQRSGARTEATVPREDTGSAAPAEQPVAVVHPPATRLPVEVQAAPVPMKVPEPAAPAGRPVRKKTRPARAAREETPETTAVESAPLPVTAEAVPGGSAQKGKRGSRKQTEPAAEPATSTVASTVTEEVLPERAPAKPAKRPARSKSVPALEPVSAPAEAQAPAPSRSRKRAVKADTTPASAGSQNEAAPAADKPAAKKTRSRKKEPSGA